MAKRIKQMNTTVEVPDTLPVKRMRIGAPGGKPFPKGHDDRRKGNGRPPGSLNKITRTMKDALVAAAVELGQLHTDKWEAEAKRPVPNAIQDIPREREVFRSQWGEDLIGGERDRGTTIIQKIPRDDPS
jgi:hypothetical protein